MITFFARYKTFFLLSFLFAGILVFQNCAEPLNESLSSQSLRAPFAYDIKMDHLAYMSCPTDLSLDPEMYFNFKLAAIGKNSGLRFTDEFQKRTRLFSENKIAELLSTDENMQGAQLQLSLRSDDLQSTYELYSDILYPLDSGYIIKEFVKLSSPTDRFNFLSFVPGLEKRGLEGTLSLGGASPSHIKGFFTNERAMLTLAYTSELAFSSPDFIFRPDPKETTTAYGLGYTFTFSTNGRSLLSMDEKNLATQEAEPQDTWVCPENLKFTVVRFKDAAVGGAMASSVYMGDDVVPGMTAEEVTAVTRVRLLLDPSQKYWFIDYKGGYLIPKQPQADKCYSSNPQYQDIPVDYGNLTADDPACLQGNTQALCPHRVSICYRAQ